MLRCLFGKTDLLVCNVFISLTLDSFLENKVTLLPCTYKIIFKSKSAKQYTYTKERKIKVKPGKTESIKFY